MGTPGDGFLAFVDVAFFNQIQKYADGDAFVARGHRQVGVIPIALHAQTLEALALQINKFGGKFARFFAEGGNIGDVFFVLFKFF